MNNVLPTFLVVGAARCGTTSLFNYLNQHPDIFIPDRKECRFFSQMPGTFEGPGADYQNDVIPDIEAYKQLFVPGKDAVARGDISNDYLFYYEQSIDNIKKYLGDDIKIIIILRNPVERAYSNYMQHVKNDWEPLSFEEALQAENDRISCNWAWPFYYTRVSRYTESVDAYLNSFNRVRVYRFEDIFKPDVKLTSLLQFIGVDPDIRMKTDRRYNISGVPKNKFAKVMINSYRRIKPAAEPVLKQVLPEKTRMAVKQRLTKKGTKPVPVNPETKKKLQARFSDDIQALSRLLDRDLSGWLE